MCEHFEAAHRRDDFVAVGFECLAELGPPLGPLFTPGCRHREREKPMTASTFSGQRHLPGRRWIRITLRTGHIVASSVLVGGHVFNLPAAELMLWLWATIATGVALIATDLYQSLLWLREVRGAAVMAKMALLLVIPVWWEARVPVLVAVIVIGSVVSHMPGRLRYWVIGRGPRPTRRQD